MCVCVYVCVCACVRVCVCVCARVFSGVKNIVLTKCPDIVENMLFEIKNCCTPYNCTLGYKRIMSKLNVKACIHSAYIAGNSHSGIKLIF